VHVPAEEGGGELARALVGNAERRIPGQAKKREEILRTEVLQRAGTDGGEVELARPPGDLFHQRLHGSVGRICLHGADIGVDLQDGEKREVVPLVRGLAIGGREDHLRSDPREQQRVAVGRCGAHRLCADGARGAGLVHDDDRLAVEITRRVLREIARGKVRIAAGGERDDQIDGPRRVLRMHERNVEQKDDPEQHHPGEYN
jgi:hypothetical protein